MRRRARSLGRRKIEMKLIEDTTARGITFSKRKNGLFNKASELSTLCGVEVAIILISMTGKMYSFGSSHVDVIIDRYLNSNRGNIPNCYNEIYRSITIKCLHQQIKEINQQLDKELSRGAAISSQEGYVDYKSYINMLDQDGLETLKNSMLESVQKVMIRLQELAFASETSTSLLSSSGKEETINSTRYDATGSPIPCDWLKL